MSNPPCKALPFLPQYSPLKQSKRRIASYAGLVILMKKRPRTLPRRTSQETTSLPERAPTNIMLTEVLHVGCLPQQPIDLIADLQTAHQLRIPAAITADAS
jgi:hypothetical protein